MGNTSRRPSQTPASTERTSLKTSASKVLQQNLAPRQSCAEGDSECPICFLTYTEFNKASCCRQNICTDCFVQLKSSADSPCPFCSRESFKVTYEASSATPSQKSNSAEKSANNNVSSSSSNTATPPPPPPLSYTTPEQERKLRSASFDHSGAPVASTADRRAIEDEIRRQRADYDDYPAMPTYPTRGAQRSASLPSTSRTPPTHIRTPSSTSTSTSTSRALPFQRSATERSPASRSTPPQDSRSTASRHTPYSRENGRSAVPAVTPPSPFLNSQFLVDEEEEDHHDFLSDDDAQLLAALQSILNSESSSRAQMPSLEQLEEMMVLEAIRQSMRDAEVSSAAETSSPVTDTHIEESTETWLPPVPPSTQPIEEENTWDDSATASTNVISSVADDVFSQNQNQDQPEVHSTFVEPTSTTTSAAHVAPAANSPDRSSPSSRLLEDIERALNTPPRPRNSS